MWNEARHSSENLVRSTAASVIDRSRIPCGVSVRGGILASVSVSDAWATRTASRSTTHSTATVNIKVRGVVKILRPVGGIVRVLPDCTTRA